MGRCHRAFSRYRPRIFTVILFCAVAAVLALSNATYPTMAFKVDGKCTHTPAR